MKGFGRALTIAVILAVMVGAAALTAWLVQVRRASVYTDGATIRAPLSDAPLRSILWQPAEPVPGADLHTGADEYEPRLSADGTLMVLVRGKPGENADLLTSRWTVEGWTTPEPIASLNTDADELGPELSRDGRSLYFYSDRAGGRGGYDLWVSRLEGDAWAEPVNLGDAVNTEHNEYGPALTPDGSALYFSSNRPRPGEPERQRDPWPATVRETRDRHDYDLYRSPVDEGVIGPAQALVALNTLHDEGAPAVSPVGDFLYFASDRPSGRGGFDLYRARRHDGAHRPAVNLGPAVNSAFNDLDPGLSTDGFRLFFSSDRPQRQGASVSIDAGERRDYGLWVTASREVFIDWNTGSAWQTLMGLLADIWPWLLLLLLALLLLLLLLRLLSDPRLHGRLRKLSLLAQCLLISLLIHALLASLLAVWKVGSEIGEFLRRSGGTRVILASASESDGVASQVRAALTTAEPIDLALEPVATEIPVEALEAATTPLAMPPMAMWDDTSRTPIEVAETRRSAPTSEASESAPQVPTPSIADARALPEPARDARATEAVPPQPAPALAESTPAPVEARPTFDASRADIAPAQPLRAARDDSRTPVDVPTPARTPEGASAPADTVAAVPEPEPTEAPRTPVNEARTARAEPERTAEAAPIALPASSAPALASPAPALEPMRFDTPATPALAVTDAARPLELATAAPAARAPSEPVPVTAPAPAPTEAPSIADARAPSAEPARRAPPTAEPAPSGPAVELATSSAPAPVSVELAAIEAARVVTTPSAIPASPARTPERLDFAPAPASAPLATETPALAALSPTLPTPAQTADTRLPVEEPLPEPVETFAQRSPEVRNEMLERAGGSERTERAVGMALEWFGRHQMPDGRWSGHRFDDRCARCGGEAEVECDAAMTGITLLCFLGAGHTPFEDGPYRSMVSRAIDWLIARQDESGDLRRGETMYSQTIATVALCEAYAMTRDERIGRAARRAVAFMLSPKNSASAQDTSVLGWQVMAVETARRAGFDVPADALDPARRWLETVSVTERNGGRYAYRRGERPNAAMTAEAMFVQQLLGRTREEQRMRESAAFILDTPPSWADGAPTYYWYYATLALFQHQGDAWRQWNERLVEELLDNQRTDGPAAGSWNPQDYWSRLGGRLYQTAVCTLSLEVYYRYRVEGRHEGTGARRHEGVD